VVQIFIKRIYFSFPNSIKKKHGKEHCLEKQVSEKEMGNLPLIKDISFIGTSQLSAQDNFISLCEISLNPR
jgi:hypothetical protein